MEFDVLILGGSFAGLSAAMQLARARRRVGILDTGQPRNRFADRAHGFYGFDGQPPLELQRMARDKVLAYPTVTLIPTAATQARADGDGFVVNETLRSKKLILAYGVNDTPPDIPGARERFGTSVLHCPYCHGYEAGDQLGVLTNNAHHAALIAEWGNAIVFTNGTPLEDREKLEARGIPIIDEPISAIRDRASVVLASGRTIERSGLFVVTQTRHNSRIAESLGCAINEGMMGPVIQVDAWRATSVPGVFAAGDISREPHNATWASADGVSAGVGAHRELVFAGF